MGKGKKAELTECSACGGQVSKSATACPHCGHPVQAEQAAKSGGGCMLYVILAGVILGLIFVFFRGAGEKPGAGAGEEVAQSEAIEELETWMPGGRDSYGAAILFKREVTKDSIVSFLKKVDQVSEGFTVIKGFSSKEAKIAEDKGNYGETYDRGYLFFYIKNPSSGVNEVRWMQEEGELAPLYGEETQL